MLSKEYYDTPPKPVLHNGHVYDSTSEAMYAQFWDNLEIKYVPHPATFWIGKKKYTPDFYLPQYDVFAEVKPVVEVFKTNDFQQKLSLTLQNNTTSIGNGIMLLTSLSFHADKEKKCSFIGSYLFWNDEIRRIQAGIWKLGVFEEDGLQIKFCEDRTSVSSCYPSLPSPIHQTKATYGRQYSAHCIYEAIRKAIYENDFVILDDADNKESGDKTFDIPAPFGSDFEF